MNFFMLHSGKKRFLFPSSDGRRKGGKWEVKRRRRRGGGGRRLMGWRVSPLLGLDEEERVFREEAQETEVGRGTI